MSRTSLTIGDQVEWWQEFPEALCAKRQSGIIRAVKTGGPLQIPGTEIEAEGSIEDPMALIDAFDEKGEDEDGEPSGTSMYLVAFSRLSKVVTVSEAPASPSSRGNYSRY